MSAARMVALASPEVTAVQRRIEVVGRRCTAHSERGVVTARLAGCTVCGSR
jgi:hypothetical protein